MRYLALLIASLASAQDALRSAESLIAAGRYEPALATLRQNSARTARCPLQGPDVPGLKERSGPHLLASKAYEGLNDPSQAVAEAEAALNLEPRSEAAHLQLGQIFLTHNTP